MAEYFVIRLDTDPSAAVEWIVVDDAGTRRGEPAHGSLEAAAAAVGELKVIALVPAASVLTTAVEIPVRRGPRLLATLPFAMEDQLAEDIESLHFAAGEPLESGRIPVAVVGLDQMQRWLDALQAVGIQAERIVAENQGLARIPGTLSMLIGEDQIFFNDGADTEIVLERMSPTEVLSIAGILPNERPTGQTTSEGAEASAHLLVYCLSGEDERFDADWETLRGRLASVDINVLPDGRLPRCAVTVAAGHGINLLQGALAPRSDLVAMVRPWRYAAAMLLVLGTLGLAGKAADYYQLARDEAALKAQFIAEYREIRPDDTREIVDPLGTVASLRRSFGGPAAQEIFLPSLRELGHALSQNASVQVEVINYRAGVIDIRLTAPDVATLDRIQRTVSDSGRFSASIQSTDQLGERVSSRIQIRESGA